MIESVVVIEDSEDAETVLGKLDISAKQTTVLWYRAFIPAGYELLHIYPYTTQQWIYI